MKIKIGLAILSIGACLASCAPAREIARQAITPRELNDRASEYDGEQVIVEGWIELAPETYRLWESFEAMQSGKNDSDCIGVSISKVNPILDRRKVALSGKFVADTSGKYVLLGGCRNARAIFVNVEPHLTK